MLTNYTIGPNCDKAPDEESKHEGANDLSRLGRAVASVECVGCVGCVDEGQYSGALEVWFVRVLVCCTWRVETTSGESMMLVLGTCVCVRVCACACVCVWVCVRV